MTLSLKSTSYMAALFVALILGFILVLGSRQYRSHKEYEAVISQNEKIIFQFATIREHINESLLENRLQQLNTITSEVENLNVNISQVLQQPIIPDEYRLSFAGQVDFAGIILLLRSIGNGDQAQAKIRQLNQEIRILGERLLLFDRVIVEHVKRKLVGFQNFVIGLLAVILIIVVYILLFWHGRIGIPLIELAKQSREISSGKRGGIALRKKSGEVAELAGSIQNLLAKQQKTTGELERYKRVLAMSHSVREAVREAPTKDAVLTEACRAILGNEDYILAWVGIPGENGQIIPVVSDGSTTMSRLERDECMTALLTAAEDDHDRYDNARKALEQKAPMITRNILDGLPRGPFKNTPFASGTQDCIGLPLIYDRQVHGVLNIYTTGSDGFRAEEVELLENMGREIVLSLSVLADRESEIKMAGLHAVRAKMFADTPDLVLAIKADGTVLEANPAAERKLRTGSGTIIGTAAQEIFPEMKPPSSYFHDRAAIDDSGISLELNHSGTQYIVRLSPLTPPAPEDTFMVVARDVSEQTANQTGIIRAAKLAALGELSVGVANEINNLTNGLINFTQILSEEIGEAAGNEGQAPELLDNIIRESERISRVVQQLLFFNTKSPHTREPVKINKIVEDSLALTRHQFSYDAIKVDANLPDNLPSVQGNVQELQYIFLNILSNARYALNQRFPGRDPRKRIEIKGEVIAGGEGAPRIKIVCTDYGPGVVPEIISRVFEPFFTTKPEGIGTGLGLSICRRIIEDNHGTLNIESIPGDHTAIIMEMPITTAPPR